MGTGCKTVQEVLDLFEIKTPGGQERVMGHSRDEWKDLLGGALHIGSENEREEAERQAEHERRDREIAEQDRKDCIERRLAQFPKRYQDATFDNYILYSDAKARDKQLKTVQALRSGNSLVLFGNNGTGKTHLVFAFLREKILENKNCRYVLAPDLFDEIRSAFGRDSDTTSRTLIDQYGRYDHLVIDELDKSFGSPAEFIGLYRIINRRYEEMKPYA